jgi:predicted transcriptional regulator
MVEYLDELKTKGLVVEEEVVEKKKTSKFYSLTKKGFDYLKEYKTVIRFMDLFGLEE